MTAHVDALEVVVRDTADPQLNASGAKKAARAPWYAFPPDLVTICTMPPSPVAILRLERTGFDLNFLDEGEIDTGAQRTINRAVHAQATVAGIGDVYAVGDVLVFETGRATDRRISGTRTTASSTTPGAV